MLTKPISAFGCGMLQLATGFGFWSFLQASLGSYKCWTRMDSDLTSIMFTLHMRCNALAMLQILTPWKHCSTQSKVQRSHVCVQRVGLLPSMVMVSAILNGRCATASARLSATCQSARFLKLMRFPALGRRWSKSEFVYLVRRRCSTRLSGFQLIHRY